MDKAGRVERFRRRYGKKDEAKGDDTAKQDDTKTEPETAKQ